MRKLILLSVVVSCLGIAQAQRVTKVFGSNLWNEDKEFTGGDTFYYKGNLFNVYFFLSFEFTNGGTQLNENDTVIIGGRLTQSEYYDDTYVIGGRSYKGLLFIVPAGGIAPNATRTFNVNGSISISASGVGQTGSANITAKCLYASSYSPIDPNSPPDLNRSFYLVQDVNAISEAELAAVKVSPTQVSSELQLTNLKNTNVAIYSLVGQQMVKYNGLSGNASIDVSGFANGIYFVRIQNGGAVRTEKIKIVR